MKTRFVVRENPNPSDKGDDKWNVVDSTDKSVVGSHAGRGAAREDAKERNGGSQPRMQAEPARALPLILA